MSRTGRELTITFATLPADLLAVEDSEGGTWQLTPPEAVKLVNQFSDAFADSEEAGPHQAGTAFTDVIRL